MLLACDPSTTRFGLAWGGQNDGCPRSMVLKGPGADELLFDKLLASVSETIKFLCETSRAERCVIEAPLMLNDRSAHTAMALIQLTGAVRAAAAKAGCENTLIAVSTVRKHFIGIGNLKSAEAKRAVMDRCRLLGWSVQDDNAGDAAAVWSWGMSTYYPRWSPRSTPLFREAKVA